MLLLQSLSQNIPIAVLEAVTFMSLVAGLGWLLGRRALHSKIDAMQMQIATKRVELEHCRESKTNPSKPKPPVPVVVEEPPLMEIPMDITPIEGIPGITAATAAPILYEEPDDLKVIEGIGPKIEQLLNNEGISSFTQLAAASPERIKEILNAAGSRFQMHDPTTWPDQA
ncbi:helix-hairpin-helix domain-containing protein, partial [Siphonobacter sp.]|uniref:helix-hairpin-helix domain-containing protein n=1 Tax=Siphonobacter sp. TaxID=1869184 RepID=UPI003B3A106D